MNIDVCFSPVLYPFYKHNEEDTVVIVTDIFRATSTMCTAMHNGAACIIPVASMDEAETYKSQGLLVGAERNVAKCSFADFGNSPFEYTPERVAGKKIVLTTTNGTQAIEMAKNCHLLLVGAFSNLQVTVNHCLKQEKRVVVLCSGWNNRFNTEDTLFAGAVCDMLTKEGFCIASDAARTALMLWQEAQNDIFSFLSSSEHFARLQSHGLTADIEYCLTCNSTNELLFLDKKTGTIVKG